MRSAILLCILLLLSSRPSSAQQCRADFDGSGAVEINELIQAVNEALGGCAGGHPTPTTRVTPTRTPTSEPAGSCPYKFNEAVSPDRFCGYSGPTTSQNCGDLLPSSSGWTTNGTDVYAIVSDSTGSLAVIGVRSNPTSATVDAVSPGPDFDQFFDATGTIAIPSNKRLTVAFNAGGSCGRISHTGTFDTLLGNAAIRAGLDGESIGSLVAALTQRAAPAAIADGRAAALRRLLGALREH